MSTAFRFDPLLESASRETQSNFSLRTGLTHLDHFVGKCPAGSLAVIGGRPSMGKTTLAYQVAHAMARESRPALIISAERGASESAAFMMSILKESDAPLSTDLPLFFADVPRIDHIGLMTAIRDMPEQPRMILIDGYEEFRFDAVQPPSLSSLPHFLKTLAQCFRAIVVVTCELPCFIEERDDFYPRLDDLNGSDPLRDIADLVLLIYRPSIYEEDTVDVDHGLVIVSVARNRHGPGGGCGLRFEGYPPRFVES